MDKEIKLYYNHSQVDFSHDVETKTCKECGETYPLDYKHWRWKDYGYAIKPISRCKFCQRKYEARKQRECRERLKLKYLVPELVIPNK